MFNPIHVCSIINLIPRFWDFIEMLNPDRKLNLKIWGSNWCQAWQISWQSPLHQATVWPTSHNSHSCISIIIPIAYSTNSTLFLLTANFVSSDRSSYSDDVLLYIHPRQLFQIFTQSIATYFLNFHSVHWCNWCYKCHSKPLKQYQSNWCHRCWLILMKVI